MKQAYEINIHGREVFEGLTPGDLILNFLKGTGLDENILEMILGRTITAVTALAKPSIGSVALEIIRQPLVYTATPMVPPTFAMIVVNKNAIRDMDICDTDAGSPTLPIS